jgi:hypothetical protein
MGKADGYLVNVLGKGRQKITQREEQHLRAVKDGKHATAEICQMLSAFLPARLNARCSRSAKMTRKCGRGKGKRGTRRPNIYQTPQNGISQMIFCLKPSPSLAFYSSAFFPS